MKTRLFQVLFAAGVLAAAVFTGLTVPASAQQQTVDVKLADGSVVPVTVDVPPGADLGDVQLPGSRPSTQTTTRPSRPTPVNPPTTPVNPPKAPATQPQAPEPTKPPTSGGGRPQAPSGDDTPLRQQERPKRRRQRRDRTGGVAQVPGTAPPSGIGAGPEPPAQEVKSGFAAASAAQESGAVPFIVLLLLLAMGAMPTAATAAMTASSARKVPQRRRHRALVTEVHALGRRLGEVERRRRLLEILSDRRRR